MNFPEVPVVCYSKTFDGQQVKRRLTRLMSAEGPSLAPTISPMESIVRWHKKIQQRQDFRHRQGRRLGRMIRFRRKSRSRHIASQDSPDKAPKSRPAQRTTLF